MKTKIAAGVLALMLTGAVGACGDDDDAASDITKEEFLEQGDAICTEANEELDAIPEPESEDDYADVIRNQIVPLIRQQVEDVRDLGFPEEDADMLEEAFDETEAILDDIDADPESVLTAEEDPFAAVNQQLTDYGFEVCSQ